MNKYVAVDVHLARTVRFFVAREKIGGGLVTICELQNAAERENILNALNRPAEQTLPARRVA